MDQQENQQEPNESEKRRQESEKRRQRFSDLEARYIKEAVAKCFRDGLADRAIKETLHAYIADAFSSAIAAELKQARETMVDELATAIAIRLGEGSASQPTTKEQPGKIPARAPSSEAEGITMLPAEKRPPKRSRWSKWKMWSKLRSSPNPGQRIATAVAVTIAVVGVMAISFRIASLTQSQGKFSNTPLPAAKGEAPSAELTQRWKEAVPLRITDISDSLLRQNLTRSANVHLRAWFGGQVEEELGNLIASNQLEKEAVREVFQGRLADYKISGTNSESLVYAAQVSAFSRLTNGTGGPEWSGCDQEILDNLPDLSSFRCDGQPGDGTFKLLNGLLECTDHGDVLTIDESASAADYLFVVYLGLQQAPAGEPPPDPTVETEQGSESGASQEELGEQE